VLDWKNSSDIRGVSYICGYCGDKAAPSRFYRGEPDDHRILICPGCGLPTYQHSETQVPGVPLGRAVSHVEKDVNDLYEEARKCASVGATTAAVLTCRKILMHLAVAKGADKGLKFIEYVDYLDDESYVPPGGRDWVDHIREKGNEANHEIVVMERGEAERLIGFVEMLLRFVYEFPGMMAAEDDT